MKVEDRKRQLKYRKKLAVIITMAMLLTGGTVATAASVNYDNKHFTIDEVESEIDIHSGKALDGDGHPINPRLAHGCEVPNDGREFVERLVDRMMEEGYSQKTIDSAVEKFELQCDNEMELASEIDLAKIEKEAKKGMSR